MGVDRGLESSSLSSICEAVVCFYRSVVLCSVNELLRQTYLLDTK